MGKNWGKRVENSEVIPKAAIVPLFSVDGKCGYGENFVENLPLVRVGLALYIIGIAGVLAVLTILGRGRLSSVLLFLHSGDCKTTYSRFNYGEVCLSDKSVG